MNYNTATNNPFTYHNLNNDDYTTQEIDSSLSSIYHDLHYLTSLEQLCKEREEMLKHKDALTEMNGVENLNDLILYGLSEEEVNNLKSIDDSVKKGKELLLKTLKEYNDCKNEIYQIEKNIKVTETTVKNIKSTLQNLTDVHNDLQEITDDFLSKLLEKQETIISDMQTDASLMICNRDKLEAIIRSLATTYNVIKNAPMHHTCPICITREVDTYLEPCGHTLCSSCNQHTHCHMCRTRIRTTKSIYYS